MSTKLINIFPTTLMHRKVSGAEALNRDLENFIVGLGDTEENRTGDTSNTGFQSELDIFHRDHPAIAALKGHIGEAIREYASVMVTQERPAPPRAMDFMYYGWSVILGTGDFQSPHVHRGSDISGVYYVAIPPANSNNTPIGGDIVFSDPRIRANMNQISRQLTHFLFSPSPGDLLLFPSSLEHLVTPIKGTGRRICIAFNVRLALYG